MMIRYLKKKNWIPYLLFLPLSMMKYPLLALTLEWILDGAQRERFRSLNDLVVPGGIILLLFFLVVFAQYIVKAQKTTLIQHALKRIRAELIQKISGSKADEVLEEQDKMVSLLLNDLKLLENDAYPSLFTILEQTVALVIAIVMIFTRSWKLGALLTIGLFLPSIFPKMFERGTVQAAKRWSQTSRQFTKQVQELLKGIVTIKSYGNEAVREKELGERIDRLAKDTARLTLIKELCGSFVLGTGLAATALCFLYGAFLVSAKEISIGGMMAVIQMSNAIYEPITSITHCRNTILSTRPIREKIKQEIRDGQNQCEARPTVEALHETLEIRNLSYRIKEKTILDHLDLKIPKGTKLLILGPNGSGKSTLLKILSGNGEGAVGELLVDGVSIKEKNTVPLIRFVQQNVFVFDDTLVNNITLKEKIRREEIERVLVLTELTSVAEEKGDSFLGEGGSHCSGGQKQKIEIARALMRKGDILLLDEAFSAIDKASAARIEAAILEKKDQTVLAVSHTVDKKNLLLYDFVLVLDQGRIASLKPVNQCLEEGEPFLQRILLEQ